MGKKHDNKKKSKKLSGGSVKSKEEPLVVKGVIREVVKTGFVVEMITNGDQPDPDNPGPTLLAHISGKLRKFNISIVPGDQVQIEVSPYDMTRGRITYRLR